MKRLLRGVLSELSYAVLRRRPAEGLRILMYHRVTDAHPGERLCVPVDAFEAQIRRLRELGLRSVSVADAVAHAREARPLPGPSIVLSFDDGYADNAQVAAPILERHGFRAIFFIPTGGMDRPEQHEPDRRMRWSELSSLLERGHEVGAHSVTHRKLTLIPAEEVAREVRDCKRTLEERLGRPVDYFCYPAGQYNATVKAAVEAAGYRGACTVEPGANRPGADPFALRRTDVSAFDTPRDLDKKLAGAYDWLHQLARLQDRLSPRARRQPSNAVPAG